MTCRLGAGAVGATGRAGTAGLGAGTGAGGATVGVGSVAAGTDIIGIVAVCVGPQTYQGGEQGQGQGGNGLRQ